MSTIRVQATLPGAGFAVDAKTEEKHTIKFDGEGGAYAATPMQTFLAATGACALMDIAVILRKKRIAFRDLRVDCEGDRPDEGHPKPFTAMRLVFRVGGEVPEKAFDDAVRLAMEKYCNIGATLRVGTVPSFSAAVDSA